MDKVQRLHAVSHLPANGRVWIPESLKTPNEPRTWANEFIEEVCVFPNAENDDYVDTFSQMLALLRDEEWISIDEFEEEEVFADTIQERHKRLANPYSV
jgi:phage terminase large subunit-like protein